MIALLLRLFPHSFRARFGPEIHQLSADLYDDARRQGRCAATRFLLHCAGDLLHTALTERLAEMSKETRNTILLAVAMGLLLGWFDTHSRSDDTGIIAGMVLLAGFSVAALFPRRPFLVGVLVGLGIPLCYGIAYVSRWLPPVPLAKYLECFIAVIPGVLGALLGAGARLLEERLGSARRRS